jgi:hypothetical protein
MSLWKKSPKMWPNTFCQSKCTPLNVEKVAPKCRLHLQFSKSCQS